MAVGSSSSAILSNTYMEHSENLALDSTQHQPLLWLHYTDDTSVVWPHGTEWSTSTIAVAPLHWWHICGLVSWHRVEHINHCCGSITLMTHLWSGLMAQSGAQHQPSLWLHYTDDTSVVWPHWTERLKNFHPPPQQFKTSHPVHHENRVRRCECFPASSGLQDGDDTGHQSLQKTHPHWLIQLQF
jgi:hypothetical protein